MDWRNWKSPYWMPQPGHKSRPLGMMRSLHKKHPAHKEFSLEMKLMAKPIVLKEGQIDERRLKELLGKKCIMPLESEFSFAVSSVWPEPIHKEGKQ